MTRINKLELITETISRDSIGQITTTESTAELIAEVRSVSQSEYMNGKQSGISPAYVFRVSLFGYSGQTIVKYNDVKYSVYRTYETDDNYVELYAEKAIGVTDA